MTTDAKALFLFPPFAHSAVNGPYLAPLLLCGILERAGIGARAVDLNIRAIRAVLSPDWIEAFEGPVLARCAETGIPSDRALFEAMRSQDGMARLARYRFGLRYSLQLIQRSLFQQPSSFGESLVPDAVGGPARARLYPALLDAVDIRPDETVCFSVAFGEQLPECLYLARLIRRRSPGQRLVLGGSQINLFTPEQLERIAGLGLFDALFVGNGEHEIARFLALVRGGPAGVYRAEPMGAEVMEDLPVPALSAADMEAYIRPWTLPILATKGCYWARCTFCDYAKMNAFCRKKYIARPPGAVLDEMAALDRRHAPDLFLLISDGVSPAWYRRLATEAVARRRGLKTWSYMLHSDVLDPPFFALLKRAGVHSINFGSETTNDRILSMMNKLGRRETILRNIREAHDAGLFVVMNIIMDFPTLSFAEAIAVADDLVDLAPSVSILNPQVFDLSTDTPIANDPMRYGLSVEDGDFCKSGHGYHSLDYARRDGLSDGQRRTVYEIYGTLASQRRLSQRRAQLAPLGDDDTVVRFDESALLYADDGPLVDILSLRLRWGMPEADWHMLARVFQEPGRQLTLERMEAVWRLGAADRGVDGRGEARAWVTRMGELGLVEAVEPASSAGVARH